MKMDELISPPVRPRMRDIASRASVSIGTVSRVLNGKSDVARDLTERVQLAAQELGYDRNQNKIERTSSGIELGTIAYLVDVAKGRVTSDPFQEQFLSGIEHAASDMGGMVVFAACRKEIQKNILPAMVARRQVSGVIVKGQKLDAWVELLRQVVPLVWIMDQPLSRDIPSVICDNFQGMYQILSHLKELGHRRVAFYYEKESGDSTSVHHLEREAAFLKYAPLMGFDVQPEYLQAPMRQETDRDLYDVIERSVKSLMELGARRPTAIIGAADIYGFAILRAVGTLGLRVPEDVSVASFMNTTAAEYSLPPLTSVSLSGAEIGKTAVELLYQRIENPEAMERHITVGTRLIPRQSCGPASAELR